MNTVSGLDSNTHPMHEKKVDYLTHVDDEYCHTVFHVGDCLLHHQQKHPNERMVIVGASFSWPAYMTKGLVYTPLSFSGNLCRFDKDSNRYEMKNNVNDHSKANFKRHCMIQGVTPEALGRQVHRFCDFTNSGSGLNSVKYLLLEMIHESSLENSLKEIAKSHIKMFGISNSSCKKEIRFYFTYSWICWFGCVEDRCFRWVS